MLSGKSTTGGPRLLLLLLHRSLNFVSEEEDQRKTRNEEARWRHATQQLFPIRVFIRILVFLFFSWSAAIPIQFYMGTALPIFKVLLLWSNVLNESTGCKYVHCIPYLQLSVQASAFCRSIRIGDECTGESNCEEQQPPAQPEWMSSFGDATIINSAVHGLSWGCAINPYSN